MVKKSSCCQPSAPQDTIGPVGKGEAHHRHQHEEETDDCQDIKFAALIDVPIPVVSVKVFSASRHNHLWTKSDSGTAQAS